MPVPVAAVVPPMPKALPVLPPRLVGEGALSAAQLEAVIMAEEAHSRDLPGRFAVKEDWTETEPTPDEGERVAKRRLGRRVARL